MSSQNKPISDDILDGIFAEKDILQSQDTKGLSISNNQSFDEEEKEEKSRDHRESFSSKITEQKTVRDQNTQTCFCHLWK